MGLQFLLLSFFLLLLLLRNGMPFLLLAFERNDGRRVNLCKHYYVVFCMTHRDVDLMFSRLFFCSLLFLFIPQLFRHFRYENRHGQPFFLVFAKYEMYYISSISLSPDCILFISTATRRKKKHVKLNFIANKVKYIH